MSNAEVAIVTGASSGVGLKVAEELLDQGMTVIGISLSWPEDLKFPALIQITSDVAEKDTWIDVDRLLAKMSDLQLTKLVINAAKLVVGPLLDISEQSIDESFEVNVKGAIMALRTCAPRMIANGRGAVVIVASTDALFAEQNLAAYCTSKGALIQLMRSFAVDYAPHGIRTNAVCPGAIYTPFFMQHVEAADDPAAFLQSKIDRHPSGRILQPEDVASAVTFLLSEGARGINGASLTVDGGLTTTFDFHPSRPSNQ
jgi:NAD(P)-dependent dehydrogenase (short-subunit alcohol dehydrogenase family)